MKNTFTNYLLVFITSNKNRPTAILLILACTLAFGCSDSDDESDSPAAEFPKVYGDQVNLASQLDIYHYDTITGDLTLARTQPIPSADIRTVTLLSATEMSDTQHSASIEYELVDGCVIDFRDYQRMMISDDQTLMTVDNLLIKMVGGSGVSGIFDCEKSNEEVIQDAVNFLTMTQSSDSVAVEYYSYELSLQQ